jgi:hypothetical protein
MAPRTVGALALRPTGNALGRYYFFSLKSGLFLNRTYATKLQMPAEVIDRVHALARRQRAQLGLLFGDRNNNPPDEDAAEDDAASEQHDDEDDAVSENHADDEPDDDDDDPADDRLNPPGIRVRVNPSLHAGPIPGVDESAGDSNDENDEYAANNDDNDGILHAIPGVDHDLVDADELSTMKLKLIMKTTQTT